MQRFFAILLIIFPLLAIPSLYYVDKVYFLCPIEYKEDIIIRNDSYGDGAFGARRNGGRRHTGIDLKAPMDFPVRAPGLGWVTEAGSRPGMGKYIKIRHSRDFSTVYGHLNKLYVQTHQIVRQGDIIAAVGKTGNANYKKMQPHLHLEVRLNDKPQDPMEYLQ